MPLVMGQEVRVVHPVEELREDHDVVGRLDPLVVEQLEDLEVKGVHTRSGYEIQAKRKEAQQRGRE